MMNKSFTNDRTSRSSAMEMIRTAAVSFSFAPITVIAMSAISSLAL